MWIFKSKEERAKIKLEKHNAYVELRKAKAKEINDNLVIYHNTFCLTAKCEPFIFQEVIYNEEKDRIECVVIFPYNEDGKYSYFNLDNFGDVMEYARKNRERWLKFKNDVKFFGVNINFDKNKV